MNGGAGGISTCQNCGGVIFYGTGGVGFGGRTCNCPGRMNHNGVMSGAVYLDYAKVDKIIELLTEIANSLNAGVEKK